MSVIYLSGELAALEIGNVVVQYAKRPSRFFNGREYFWDKNANEFRRWARNRRGGLFFTRIIEEPEQVAQDLGNAAEVNKQAAQDLGNAADGKRTQSRHRNHLSKEEIELIMKNNEKELAPILAKMGRTILPDAIYGGHFSVRKGDLDQHGEIIRSLPDKDVALANMTIDLYALNDKGNWIIIQRRIYDDNGVAIQDFDYTHQDTKGTHLFPHIHVWINGKRIGLILKYRKK